MAMVELVGICKTLRLDDRPVLRYPPIPGPAISRAKADLRTAMAGEGTTQPFSLQDINLLIPDGKTMVIVGPSGCGKTTLLRIIAGLIKPDSGVVKYDGLDVTDIPPAQRHIGMVFQNYALYPHLTSKTNILSYFFFRKRTPKLDRLAREKYERTSRLMGVEIAYLLDRKPSGLSGGERQRVALGRCITRDPRLFLLDEPFSNLDRQLREKYRTNLRVLLKDFHITTVYVTHDQQEALILADLIAIMDIGRIAQVGTYGELYHKPDSIFVAEFMSPSVYAPAINLIDGERVSGELRGACVGVRPEDIEITQEKRGYGLSGLLAHVTELPNERQYIATVNVGETVLYARVAAAPHPAASEPVWLGLKMFHIFDRKTGERIRSVTKSASDPSREIAKP